MIAHGDAAGAAEDHGGDEDDLGGEAAELHVDPVAPVGFAVQHHREPGLDVPGQGGDDHVGPVGDQVVERHPQRVDPVLELLDDVFLVAAVVGAGHDLGGGQVGAGGDVEEVADLVDEGLLAAGLADVLAQRDDAVGSAAFAGLVGELGDILVVEFEVEIAAFGDDAPLVVGFASAPRPAAWLGRRRVGSAGSRRSRPTPRRASAAPRCSPCRTRNRPARPTGRSSRSTRSRCPRAGTPVRRAGRPARSPCRSTPRRRRDWVRCRTG